MLADLYFAKVWLARRFTRTRLRGESRCDGNAPLPFARGDAFSFAMCSDAFQYIWTKRQSHRRNGSVGSITAESPVPCSSASTHNERQWSPSHGQPLAPEGYRDLFETLTPRIFGETCAPG